MIRIILALVLLAQPLRAETPEDVLTNWYRLSLELVRHTPTHSPPVASRTLAYLGITAWEVTAAADPALHSLSGQLTGLTAMPARPEGIDQSVALDTALQDVVAEMFAHTGPTGQRAMAAMAAKVADESDTAAAAYGHAVARHILDWAATDGGAVIENMGFPMTWTPSNEPGRWVPTSKVVQQQAPLLPQWGENRHFALLGKACEIPPPTAYSADPASQFFAEAKEVADAAKNLTADQTMIARFWSDDAMLTFTPPGHWINIALQILDARQAPMAERADVLARLGIAMADAFIATWQVKFHYDLLRPVTFIKAHIDKGFEPILTTPPFPEYPSGHSVQSGAAQMVMESAFGTEFGFDDATLVDDGLESRHFTSFSEAAAEAAISRLYGGIHFRPAIEDGIDFGHCIGNFAAGLTTR